MVYYIGNTFCNPMGWNIVIPEFRSIPNEWHSVEVSRAG
jgi:hypothetical protein